MDTSKSEKEALASKEFAWSSCGHSLLAHNMFNVKLISYLDKSWLSATSFIPSEKALRPNNESFRSTIGFHAFLALFFLSNILLLQKRVAPLHLSDVIIM